jgi:hypothetical protein
MADALSAYYLAHEDGAAFLNELIEELTEAVFILKTVLLTLLVIMARPTSARRPPCMESCRRKQVTDLEPC